MCTCGCGGGGCAAVGGGYDAEDLLPRADISASITPALLTNLGSANWKERKQGLDDVEALLVGAGGRIQPQVRPAPGGPPACPLALPRAHLRCTAL